MFTGKTPESTIMKSYPDQSSMQVESCGVQYANHGEFRQYIHGKQEELARKSMDDLRKAQEMFRERRGEA
jgi:hypothetical protein